MGFGSHVVETPVTACVPAGHETPPGAGADGTGVGAAAIGAGARRRTAIRLRAERSPAFRATAVKRFFPIFRGTRMRHRRPVTIAKRPATRTRAPGVTRPRITTEDALTTFLYFLTIKPTGRCCDARAGTAPVAVTVEGATSSSPPPHPAIAANAMTSIGTVVTTRTRACRRFRAVAQHDTTAPAVLRPIPAFVGCTRWTAYRRLGRMRAPVAPPMVATPNQSDSGLMVCTYGVRPRRGALTERERLVLMASWRCVDRGGGSVARFAAVLAAVVIAAVCVPASASAAPTCNARAAAQLEKRLPVTPYNVGRRIVTAAMGISP